MLLVAFFHSSPPFKASEASKPLRQRHKFRVLKRRRLPLSDALKRPSYPRATGTATFPTL
jgi:hypothetical protein